MSVRLLTTKICFILSAFLLCLPTQAQEFTVSSDDIVESGLEVQIDTLKKIQKKLDDEIKSITNCGGSEQFATSIGCQYINESEPETNAAAKAPMISCTGSNELAKWDGSKWYCESITVPNDCVGRAKLSECSTNSLSLQSGQKQSGVTCEGQFGTCNADVTCNNGSYSVSNEFCPKKPQNCYASVGGTGCSAYHNLNHGEAGDWSCDTGYTGSCSAVCNSGNFESVRNSCVGAGTWKPSPWSACSNTCGTGTQTRTYSCEGGICDASKPADESRACVDTSTCGYTWQSGTWSTCSQTCGGGTQTRSVICKRSDGTTVADGQCKSAKPATSQTCNTGPCTKWSMACPNKLCGPNTTMPSCPSSNPTGTTCTTSGALCDASTGRYKCGSGSVAKHTFSWKSGAWGTCSKTCNGTQTRTVTCNRDSDNKVFADSNCSGTKPATSQTCGTTCPTTGPWSAGSWSSYGSCSKSCGGGTQTRTRSVTCSYDSCTGAKPPSSESKSCNTQACATSGPWSAGAWSSYGACSKSCGGGTQTRTRSVTCTFDSCTGAKPPSSESKSCNTQACATSGPWSAGNWGSWSTCSPLCNGTQSRTRSVTCAYDSCTGSKPSTSESRSCSSPLCPTYGPWTTGSWSKWGSCNKSCGGGTQTRTRPVYCTYDNCTDPKPSSTESKSCNTTACPSYSWQSGSWGSCSKSCGGGTQTRSVSCKRSDGQTVSASYCSGSKPATSQSCNTQACAPSGCDIRHPIGWTVQAHCAEYYLRPGGTPGRSHMFEGQVRTISARYCSDPMGCTGEITIKCQNGGLKTLSKSCKKGGSFEK